MADKIMPLSQAVEGYDIFDKMQVLKVVFEADKWNEYRQEITRLFGTNHDSICDKSLYPKKVFSWKAPKVGKLHWKTHEPLGEPSNAASDGW